jgi:hypothetical protein
MTIYAGSKRRSMVLQRLAVSLVSILGPRALPGKTVGWQPPMDRSIWDGMLADWEQRLGAFDAVAVYLRRQSSRAGFSVLLIDGSATTGFVKIQPGSVEGLTEEFRAQDQVYTSKPRSFRVPAPLVVEESGGWAYLAMEPLPARIHTPAFDPPLDSVLKDIERGLDLDPRPATVPEHWSPMHGDLTPWNLRKSAGELFLMDWENVGWGPPGADQALFTVATAALRHRRVRTALNKEAVAFWRDQIVARPSTGGQNRLRADLLRELNRCPLV